MMSHRNLNEEGILFSSRLKSSRGEKRKKSSGLRKIKKHKTELDIPFGFTHNGNTLYEEPQFDKKKGKVKKSKLGYELQQIKNLKDLKNSKLLNSKLGKRLKKQLAGKKKHLKNKISNNKSQEKKLYMSKSSFKSGASRKSKSPFKISYNGSKTNFMRNSPKLNQRFPKFDKIPQTHQSFIDLEKNHKSPIS